MSIVLIETDELEKIINKAVSIALEGHVSNNLPPLLTRQQFMELLEIGATKAAELFNRPGFPVTREFGNPRVITRLLLLWAEENSEWMSQNASLSWKSAI
ncbi:DNA-binding protein [Paenibacillus sp. FSL L8-0494]|uniref:DNA-binding protein n=1 Tax=Paenibacillus sp. FSL L8-0494 TaxID=2975352 RepID=UPI0030F6D0FE